MQKIRIVQICCEVVSCLCTQHVPLYYATMYYTAWLFSPTNFIPKSWSLLAIPSNFLHFSMKCSMQVYLCIVFHSMDMEDLVYEATATLPTDPYMLQNCIPFHSKDMEDLVYEATATLPTDLILLQVHMPFHSKDMEDLDFEASATHASDLDLLQRCMCVHSKGMEDTDYVATVKLPSDH